MLATTTFKTLMSAFVLAASTLGIAPAGTILAAQSAEAQTYRYRPTPNYRYRPARSYRPYRAVRPPVYRAPRAPNRVQRGISTLSRWNGNAERRAARRTRWAAERGR